MDPPKTKSNRLKKSDTTEDPSADSARFPKPVKSLFLFMEEALSISSAGWFIGISRKFSISQLFVMFTLSIDNERHLV
jgi:hypothetical protein